MAPKRCLHTGFPAIFTPSDKMTPRLCPVPSCQVLLDSPISYHRTSHYNDRHVPSIHIAPPPKHLKFFFTLHCPIPPTPSIQHLLPSSFSSLLISPSVSISSSVHYFFYPSLAQCVSYRGCLHLDSVAVRPMSLPSSSSSPKNTASTPVMVG